MASRVSLLSPKGITRICHFPLKCQHLVKQKDDVLKDEV